MKKDKFKIISLIMIIILIIQISVVSTFAASGIPLINSNVKGIVSLNPAGNTNFDITEIRFNVYKLKLSQKLEYGDDYEHIFECSVSPNEEGNVTFTRPSQYCYVELNLDSLSEEFGAESSSVLLKPDENEFNFVISEIKGFDVNILNDSTTFYDKDNHSLQANSVYNVEYQENLEEALLNNNAVEAQCSVGDLTLNSSVDVDSISTLDKVNYLYDNNLITETEKIKYYINILKDEKLNEIDTMNIMSQIFNFQQNNEITSNLQSKINDISYLNNESYSNEATYTRGFFTIHYEKGTLTNANLTKICDLFDYARDSLCYSFKFKTPTLKTGERTYQVYIVNDSSLSWAGLTNLLYNSDGSKYSYISINLCDGLTDYALCSIVHEFMHSVQWNYGSYIGEYVYFNESVANAIAVRLLKNCDISYYIDNFLNSPELSLFSSSTSGDYEFRCYGATLYPMYIAQEHDDFNTIKKIYEQYSTSNNIYTAIDNALAEYDSDLVDAYLGCMVYNYNVSANYTYYQSEWQNSAKKTAVSTKATSYTLPYLSTRYFELAGTQSNDSRTFTFTLTDSTDNSSACLNRIYTNKDGIVSTDRRGFTGKTRTITTILHVNAKVCMLMSDISYTDNVGFSVYIS